MNKYLILSSGLFFLVMYGCIKEKDTEALRPVIDILSPTPCDTMYFGDTFQFNLSITAINGLGNISMDIHHNFGHHSHGSHGTCSMDAPKAAVHPWSENWIFKLPSNKTEYVLDTLLMLPAMKDATTFYDTGDYHFHIYVTDNDGYLVFTTLDVKIR
jgi:hypothetical protein